MASWFPPGPSLFLCLIVGGNRSPPWLTHTHTHTLASKAGSDNRAGLDIEQGASLPGRTCTTASLAHAALDDISAYTHWTLGLLCPGDMDAGRIGAPMGIAGISTCTHWPLITSITGTASTSTWRPMGRLSRHPGFVWVKISSCPPTLILANCLKRGSGE